MLNYYNFVKLTDIKYTEFLAGPRPAIVKNTTASRILTEIISFRFGFVAVVFLSVGACGFAQNSVYSISFLAKL